MSDGRRILVTGGAGFIGSHLTERLASDHQVSVLDDFSTGAKANVEFLPQSQIIDGNVLDKDIVRQAVADKDTVIHLAAVMGVRRTLERPLDVLKVNIEGTLNVLEEAAKSGVTRIVLASTSEVYGDAPEPPYTEDDATCPESNYAVAKLAAERLTMAVSGTYDVNCTILRYFNVYGPRQDSSSYGYVVPIFVRHALDDEELEIHGSGEQTRDFTHIEDAIDCTVAALGPEGEDEIFNVGTGIETSIQELADLVVSSVGGGTTTHVEHPRPYVINRRCADVSKARTQLTYEPQVPLEEGIKNLPCTL